MGKGRCLALVELGGNRGAVERGGFEPPKASSRQVYSLLRLAASLPLLGSSSCSASPTRCVSREKRGESLRRTLPPFGATGRRDPEAESGVAARPLPSGANRPARPVPELAKGVEPLTG